MFDPPRFTSYRFEATNDANPWLLPIDVKAFKLEIIPVILRRQSTLNAVVDVDLSLTLGSDAITGQITNYLSPNADLSATATHGPSLGTATGTIDVTAVEQQTGGYIIWQGSQGVITPVAAPSGNVNIFTNGGIPVLPMYQCIEQNVSRIVIEKLAGACNWEWLLRIWHLQVDLKPE